MKALVISGGGSKGAFAGGVAQYLMEENQKEYDLFIGTSTGSMMVSHLALGKIKELKKLYTNVSQATIFSSCPFKVKRINNYTTVSINHFNTLKNFIRGSKTFGESHNLKKLINREIPKDVIDGYEPDPSIKAEPITRGRGQQQKRPRRKSSGSSSKKSPRPGKNARRRSTENGGGNSGNKTSSPWKKQSNGNSRTRDAA